MRRLAVALALGATMAPACNAELSPGATVAQAASETEGAGSARVVYDAAFQLSSVSGPVEMSGRGVFDYVNHRGRMLFDMSDIMQQNGTPLDGADEVEMIFQGSVLYMKVPFLTRSLADPRPWIKVDLDRAAQEGRTDLAQITQLAQGDPTQMLRLLRGLTGTVRDVGTQELHGAATTHYKMVLDLSKITGDDSAQTRTGAQTLIARAGSNRLPADIWIDGDGRMRKMTYGAALAQTSGEVTASTGDEDEMSVTMELYGFGVAVDFPTPSDDQVVDLLDTNHAQQGSS
jgi:hypothetical protein